MKKRYSVPSNFRAVPQHVAVALVAVFSQFDPGDYARAATTADAERRRRAIANEQKTK